MATTTTTFLNPRGGGHDYYYLSQSEGGGGHDYYYFSQSEGGGEHDYYYFLGGVLPGSFSLPGPWRLASSYQL